MKHIFIVGAKGIGAYGGYETFVDKLTEYHQNNKKIKYHIACKANGDGCMDEAALEGAVKLSEMEFSYHNARCFKVRVPDIGSAQAIYYDTAALAACCRYIKEKGIRHPIVYILACRIGPLAGYFQKRIHKLGGKMWVNPDGHEFLRGKWPLAVRKYWKMSEQMMVKRCDLVVCDSVSIEKYIHKCYDRKGAGRAAVRTAYIAYGAETRASRLADDDPEFTGWLAAKGLEPKNYYLAVGRLVPENNFEVMIREFMGSHSKKNFAVIATENSAFLGQLEAKLHFRADPRIKFVGTVYNQELLMKIRENAYGYFHGHEVGGTNPSLLEALGSTDLNLLLGVSFNREVARNAALYWSKSEGSLAGLIRQADQMGAGQLAEYGRRAKERIRRAYSWEYIAGQYEKAICSK